MKTKTVTIDGRAFPVRFERRRYGTGASSRFFTWAYVTLGGESVSLGDPWPCVTPAKRELEWAIIKAILDREPKA